jgi:LSD1 subclass zinc finger protein
MMGITTAQRLQGLAQEFEYKERKERAFENALVQVVKELNECSGCEKHLRHPNAAYHVDCACAEEARRRMSDELHKEKQ